MLDSRLSQRPMRCQGIERAARCAHYQMIDAWVAKRVTAARAHRLSKRRWPRGRGAEGPRGSSRGVWALLLRGGACHHSPYQEGGGAVGLPIILRLVLPRLS
jgi:hypothetical protein